MTRDLEMRSYTWNGCNWEWNGDGWPVDENMSTAGDFSAYGESDNIRLGVWCHAEEVAVFFGTVHGGEFVLGN